MFSSANNGPENKGPDNDEFKDFGSVFLPIEEKVWKSPTPLLFKNGEITLYDSQPGQISKTFNIAGCSIFGSLILFSGYKLYEYFGNGGPLILFGLGLSYVLLEILIESVFAANVYEIRLLNDVKRIKMRTLMVGIKYRWEIIDFKKIQKTKPANYHFGSPVCSFKVGAFTYYIVDSPVPNTDLLNAVLSGYNIGTSNF